MKAGPAVPEFVIRLTEVSLGRGDLEARLGVGLDRYETSRHGALNYAQVSMDHGDGQWSSVASFLKAIGPRIEELIAQRTIGSATMDFAIHVPDDKVALSSTVPARIALLAGQSGIDIETSIYLTSSDSGETTAEK